MTTLQVYRLENTSGEHYKQYTCFAGPDGGFCFFGFSRIGNVWQWLVKENQGDPLGKMLSQKHSKESGGYEQVWCGDITVPRTWAEDPKTHGHHIQHFVEDLFRKDLPAGTVGTPVGMEPARPLSDLLDNARSVVTEMANNRDDALTEYAALLRSVEAAQEDLDTVSSYMETLQIMLAGGGNEST